MATVHGIVHLPIDDAMTETRRVASEQGYALAEGESGPSLLVFTKGVTAVSWGSEFHVTFEQVAPAATQVTVTTGETFAITDWGRGKRASHRLLDALGAE
jgi:hypothetical protein